MFWPTLSQRGEGEMGILMDWIVLALDVLLLIFVLNPLKLLIRVMLGVG
jgi:hypothetical protein